jgi:Fur family zinc uptake transcriptional regulator
LPHNPPFEKHDHAACRKTALAQADAICAKRGLRLTPIRRRVLEILLESHVALGAYDVLERLREEGHAAQPPVAYRALDFLVEYGLAHRIERLSAFIACHHPDGCHAPAFLICRACNLVAEAQTEPKRGPLAQDAQALGFVIEEAIVEAQGLCPACNMASK